MRDVLNSAGLRIRLTQDILRTIGVDGPEPVGPGRAATNCHQSGCAAGKDGPHQERPVR
jgi:hypothetical protein